MTTTTSRTFYIKQGDTGPAIVERLLNADGTIPDLTDAEIRFHVARANGTLIVDADAVIVDALDGTVSYQWVDGDTDLAGTFYREWEVTLASGEIVTFPNDRLGDETVMTAQPG